MESFSFFGQDFLFWAPMWTLLGMFLNSMVGVFSMSGSHQVQAPGTALTIIFSCWQEGARPYPQGTCLLWGYQPASGLTGPDYRASEYGPWCPEKLGSNPAPPLTLSDPGASSLPSKPYCCSVAKSYPTLCDPMDCSTPGFPVHHQLPELAQTHVYWVGDDIQRSHPLSSPSPPDFNLSQHQGLFQWVRSSHQVAKVVELQLQHQSFQWLFRTDLL